MNKLILQIATAILSAVPIVTGIVGLLGVLDPLYAGLKLPSAPLLDSNLRFFSGLWLGLGLAVCWLIPRIAEQTTLFRFLWGMIFLGGIGRLLSIYDEGLPPTAFVGFTALEIFGAPIFIYWQYRVAKTAMH